GLADASAPLDHERYGTRTFARESSKSAGAQRHARGSRVGLRVSPDPAGGIQPHIPRSGLLAPTHRVDPASPRRTTAIDAHISDPPNVVHGRPTLARTFRSGVA